MDLPPIRKFTTRNNIRIYQIPIEAFPNFLAYAYLVIHDQGRVLIDTGTGFGSAADHLLGGIAAVQADFGEEVSPATLTRIIITHGHIDHYGGLTALRDLTDAPIGVHRLDLRVLQHYEERLAISAQHLHRFLKQAGVGERRQGELLTLYTAIKHLFRSVNVAFTLEEDAPPLDGIFRFYHTPGHCPGQVCIGIEDILLVADHVLSRTTPHQAPESITTNMGLGHYLEALKTIEHLPDVRVALAGHEDPIENLDSRIGEIRASHRRKLDAILGACAEPITIQGISRTLFGKVGGYEVILALEEAGAHVEYLYERGRLRVANLDAVTKSPDEPILYQRIESL